MVHRSSISSTDNEVFNSSHIDTMSTMATVESEPIKVLSGNQLLSASTTETKTMDLTSTKRSVLPQKKITRSSNRLSIDKITENLRLSQESKTNLNNSSDTSININTPIKSVASQNDSGVVCEMNESDLNHQPCVQDISQNEISVPLPERKPRRKSCTTRKRSIPIEHVEPTILIDETKTEKELSPLRLSPLSDKSVSELISTVHESATVSGTYAIKSLCLYCDRVLPNVKACNEHTEKTHQLNANRRISSRNSTTNTSNVAACSYCSTSPAKKTVILPTSELTELFYHFLEKHSDKYHGCRSCQIRFTNNKLLVEHQEIQHGIKPSNVNPDDKSNDGKRKKSNGDINEKTNESTTESSPDTVDESITAKIKTSDVSRRVLSRSQSKQTLQENKLSQQQPKKKILSRLGIAQNRSPRTRKSLRHLTNSESSRSESNPSPANNFLNNKPRASRSRSKTNTQSTQISPMEIDLSATAILKSTNTRNELTLTTSFDEDFYENVITSVKDNLSCFVDGKLASGPMSPSPLSPVAAIPAVKSTVVRTEIPETDPEIHEATALSAQTAFPTLLTAEQFGQETHPSKLKKPITKNSWKWKWDSVKKYKYVNEGGKMVKKIKHPVSGLRDLSKLDMWTQLTMRVKHEVIKRKDRLSSHESYDKDVCSSPESAREGKRKMVEELNTILDSRMLPQINLEQNEQRVIKLEPEEVSDPTVMPVLLDTGRSADEEMFLRSQLQLKKQPNQNSNNNELVLSGEWARPRCYLCYGCGAKFDTKKGMEDHKIHVHPNVYATHYEVVGRELIENNLYKHLFIPERALSATARNTQQSESSDADNKSKDTTIEDSMDSITSYTASYVTAIKSDSIDTDSNSNSRNSKVSTNTTTNSSVIKDVSDSNTMEVKVNCSKCKRECNGRSELYRHMLDCSGDYIWMQAKKRFNVRYRYFGNRKRRNRKNHITTQLIGIRKPRVKSTAATSIKSEENSSNDSKENDSSNKNTNTNNADPIQRMLENLPAKRACRTILSTDNLSKKKRTTTVKKTKIRLPPVKSLAVKNRIKKISSSGAGRNLTYVTSSTVNVIGKSFKKRMLKRTIMTRSSGSSKPMRKVSMKSTTSQSMQISKIKKTKLNNKSTSITPQIETDKTSKGFIKILKNKSKQIRSISNNRKANKMTELPNLEQSESIESIADECDKPKPIMRKDKTIASSSTNKKGIKDISSASDTNQDRNISIETDELNTETKNETDINILVQGETNITKDIENQQITKLQNCVVRIVVEDTCVTKDHGISEEVINNTDNLPIPDENKFATQLHLDITRDTSPVKSKSPLISPNKKRKLSDCIAMLAGKLEEKTGTKFLESDSSPLLSPTRAQPKDSSIELLTDSKLDPHDTNNTNTVDNQNNDVVLDLSIKKSVQIDISSEKEFGSQVSDVVLDFSIKKPIISDNHSAVEQLNSDSIATKVTISSENDNIVNTELNIKCDIVSEKNDVPSNEVRKSKVIKERVNKSTLKENTQTTKKNNKQSIDNKMQTNVKKNQSKIAKVNKNVKENHLVSSVVRERGNEMSKEIVNNLYENDKVINTSNQVNVIESASQVIFIETKTRNDSNSPPIIEAPIRSRISATKGAAKTKSELTSKNHIKNRLNTTINEGNNGAIAESLNSSLSTVKSKTSKRKNNKQRPEGNGLEKDSLTVKENVDQQQSNSTELLLENDTKPVQPKESPKNRINAFKNNLSANKTSPKTKSVNNAKLANSIISTIESIAVEKTESSPSKTSKPKKSKRGKIESVIDDSDEEFLPWDPMQGQITSTPIKIFEDEIEVPPQKEEILSTTIEIINETESQPIEPNSVKRKKKKRKNELTAIIADQLLESFKEVDKSKLDDLKRLHDLAYESGDERLLASNFKISAPPKRRTANMAREVIHESVKRKTIDHPKDVKMVTTKSTRTKVKTQEKSSLTELKHSDPKCKDVIADTDSTTIVKPSAKKKNNKLNRVNKKGHDQKEEETIFSNIETNTIKVDDNTVIPLIAEQPKLLSSDKIETESQSETQIDSGVDVISVTQNLEQNNKIQSNETVDDEKDDLKNVPAISSSLPKKPLLRPSILSFDAAKTSESDATTCRLLMKTALRLSVNEQPTKNESFLSQIVNKIKNNTDNIESDEEDSCLAQIAESVNNKLKNSDEFNQDDDSPPELTSLSLPTTSQTETNISTMNPPLRTILTEKKTEDDDLSDDGGDFEDDASCYTSFSIDTAATQSKRRRRRYRRSVLMRSNKRMRRNMDPNSPVTLVPCELCNKSFRSIEGLNKHKMTIMHISRVSKEEFLNAENNKRHAENVGNEVAPQFVEDQSSGREEDDDLDENRVTIPDQANLSPQIPESMSKSAESQLGLIPKMMSPKHSLNDKMIPLNQNCFEPISSPEMPDNNYDRYNTNNMNVVDKRLNLSKEQRLFYECCNLLKGSEQGGNSLNKNYRLNDKGFGNGGDPVVKPVTPKSNEHYSAYLGSDLVGQHMPTHAVAYSMKSPQSHHSPRSGIPKIDFNHFSDISSDSNPAFSKSYIPKTMTPERINNTPAASNHSAEDDWQAKIKMSNFMATAQKYQQSQEPFKSVMFSVNSSVKCSPSSRPSKSTDVVYPLQSYHEPLSDMGDSFPSSQDASESETYVQAVTDRCASTNTDPKQSPVKTASSYSSPIQDSVNPSSYQCHIGGKYPSTSGITKENKLSTSISPPFTSPIHSTSSQGSSCCKVRTKAALKGFENLKVSIPTSGIDLQQALDRSPHSSSKLAALAEIALGSNATLISPLQEEKLKSASPSTHRNKNKLILPLKNLKKHNGRQRKNQNKKISPKFDNNDNQNKDIYDFEDSFEASKEKFDISTHSKEKLSDKSESKLQTNAGFNTEESQLSGYSDRDDFNYASMTDRSLVQSSSDSEDASDNTIVTKKSVKPGNNTQTKSLIMGRIFKKVKKSEDGELESSSTDVINVKKSNQKPDLNKVFDSLREEVTTKNSTKTTTTNTDDVLSVRAKTKDPSASLEMVNLNISVTDNPQDVRRLEADFGMSISEIKHIMGIDKRNTQKRRAACRQTTIIERSDDEYEDFHATKDILALIQEAERKAERSKSISGRKKDNSEDCSESKKKLSKTIVAEAIKTVNKCIKKTSKKNENEVDEKPSIKKKIKEPETKSNMSDKKDKNSEKKPIAVKRPQSKKMARFMGMDPDSDFEAEWGRTNAKRSKIRRRRKTLTGREETTTSCASKGNKKKITFELDGTSAIKNDEKSTETGSPKGQPVARRKRVASEMLYYWSSSSSDEETVQTAEIQTVQETDPTNEDDDESVEQHGWIVGDSHKKLVKLLAHAKGKIASKTKP